jgi:hypothetical protein
MLATMMMMIMVLTTRTTVMMMMIIIIMSNNNKSHYKFKKKTCYDLKIFLKLIHAKFPQNNFLDPSHDSGI